MGWITYDGNGRLVNYYKKIGPAKAAVTRHRRSKELFGWAYPTELSWCSYKDYEGVCIGLRGDALKMWQFCNTATRSEHDI